MEQKTYPQEEHRLSLEEIDPDALYVMEKLRKAGFSAYLVGGSVRDLLLGKHPKDFDISTSAEPEQIKKVFRNCILIGKRFRLAHIRFGKKIIEVATFRSGDIESTDLVLRDNKWGTPEEDAVRRDFTINGLYYDSANQTIIDYVGGYPDIQRKYLRTIGTPFVRFKQDPVRMIRLLKFVARFGLDIDPEARIALMECRHEILKSSSARVLEELLRMLESGASQTFFRLMTEHRLTELMIPVLGEFLETEEGKEVYSYLQEVDTTQDEVFERPLLVSCLLWPLFQKRISVRFEERGRHPHLGEIYHEASQLCEEVFRVFLHIPRRLRYGITTILTTQYRLTPLEKKRFRRLRVPHDPDFPLALKFLALRAHLEPGLKIIWQEWDQASQGMTQAPEPPKRKRSRRRKRNETADDQ